MRWLDRLWLAVIALAFLFLAPVWVVLWYERHPLLGLTQAGLLIWLVQGWLRSEPPRQSDQ